MPITKVRPVQGRATPSIMLASKKPATSINDAMTNTPVTQARTLLLSALLAWSNTLFAKRNYLHVD
jgi:hypothetical protein